MTGPVIVAAAVAPGHDGLAEIAIDVRYPNGATRSLSLPYDAIASALDAAGVTSLDELVGRPWTTLAHDAAITTTSAPHASVPIQGAP